MTSKPTKARSVLSNAGWNALGTLFNVAIAFLLAPLLIDRLGVDQWGLLLLVWSITGVLGLANFGLGEATMRFVAHYHADGDLAGVNRVLGATLSFYVAVCSLVSCIVWFAAPLIVSWVKVPTDGHYPVETLVRLTPFLFSAGMIANAFHGIPMALHRYDVSNAVASVQNVVRSTGLVLLVLAGFEVVHLVRWEIVVASLGLLVRAHVAGRLLPGIRRLPSTSLAGMRETIGYSMWSFMTHVFHTIYREAGRLIVGNRLGTASVAHLGTPDSIAYRLHMIIISGIETLVPRFSANRDAENAKMLLAVSTWSACACGAVVYVPLAVLMPDFLRLWINADFARESGEVGRLVTLGLIGSAVFSPIATLFRGTGKPAFVTAVMVAVGILIAVGSVVLIPSLGVIGVGYAYVASAFAWIGGLWIGWGRLYGAGSWGLLARIAGLPLIVAAVLYGAEVGVRGWWGQLDWLGFVLTGAVFSIIGAVAVVGFDLLLRGASPARLMLARVVGAERGAA